MKQTRIRFLLYGWLLTGLWYLPWVIVIMGIGLFHRPWFIFLTPLYLFAVALFVYGIFVIRRALRRGNYYDHPIKVPLLVALHITSIAFACLMTLFCIQAAKDDWELEHNLFSTSIPGAAGSGGTAMILTISLAVYVAHLIVAKRLAMAK